VFVMTARIPPEGIELFGRYEDLVLAVLPDHGGKLLRRVRSEDGTLEVHLVQFRSEAGFASFRADPRRVRAAPLLERSRATVTLDRLFDAAGPGAST
jgi:hypothetical protein